MTGPDPQPPLFVVRGDASAEEVAALVAVLQAMRAVAAGQDTGRPAASEWSAPRRRVRGPLSVPAAGPGVWRASGLPR